MDEMFRFADELGPARIVHISEPASNLRAVVVVDNVACGPSIGGLRMAPDVSTEECLRLARAMTLKNAAAGIPHGGGKSVVVADPRMPAGEKEQLIRCFAQAIRNINDYIVGPDMGTDETCMAWIKDEIGRAVGLPPVIGGIPLDEIGATGYGLSACIDVAREFCDLDLEGARVAVQGFGSVGKHVARFLGQRGAVLVAAADSLGTLVNADGIDVQALIAIKDAGGSVCDYQAGNKRDREAVIDVECDIWIPAARPDVIHADNVDRLSTRLVVQGANIPITPEAEARLHERGILSIPDFIANAGGVVCAAVEYRGGTEAAALETIDEKIRTNTQAVLQQATATGKPPREAAVQLATTRLHEAMRYRRQFVSGLSAL
jgi:glutamate dehydrogenase/leucine dehydrogenase